MDFQDNANQAIWRTEVKDFLDEYLPEEIRNRYPSFATSSNAKKTPEQEAEEEKWESWRVALAERGWIAPAWPKEYGGAGMGPMDQFILSQEFAERGAPRLGGLGLMMLGPTLIAHGTEEQKKEHIPGILSGKIQWCQGYSEPGSGSDLASLQTRAVRDGDDWVINGQKIWTSLAHVADWCFMLARTDPDAPKHRGITYFLLDMKTPGVTVRPLVNMTNGHDFNEVFFEDVRVPSRNIIGEINRGWYAGTTPLDFERSSIGTPIGLRQAVEKNLDWLREHKDDLPETTYAAAKHDWADRWIEVQTSTMLAYRIISMQDAGEIPNSESSIAKLFTTELSQRVAKSAAQMVGMWGDINDPKAPLKGMPGHGYVNQVRETIAGGTSEIQRNIIATRGLGLPRTQ